MGHSDKFAIILLLLLLPMSIFSCTTTQSSTEELAGRVAYYGHMPFRESPFADLRGIYPMSKSQSHTQKHYRIIFDAYDRPIEVSFRLGDRIQNLNVSRNALTFTPVIRVDYESGREIRTFFDRHMNPTLANNVFREVYELDEDGNRASLHFFDVEGERIESGWGVYAYNWSVDRRGIATEKRVDSEGLPVSIRPNFPFFCLKLHYDQRGLLALMENYGLDCEQLTLNDMNAAQDKLQHNAQGGTYAWNVYDADENRSIGNGPMVARGVMQRDSRGHTIREYYEDSDGNIMTNAYGWTNTYAVFDKHGNLVGRFNHDKNGNRINNPQLAYSGYVMTFDARGEHRISLRYQSADGAPATHSARGYHAVLSDYDTEGNRIRSRFQNVDGDLVSRLDYCAAIFDYSYDKQNRLTAMRLFNANLQPASHCDEGWHEKRYIYHIDGALMREERVPIGDELPDK